MPRRRGDDPYRPRHARPHRSRRSSLLPIAIIVALYVVAIALSEWRLDRHVRSVRASTDETGVSVDRPTEDDGLVSNTAPVGS